MLVDAKKKPWFFLSVFLGYVVLCFFLLFNMGKSVFLFPLFSAFVILATWAMGSSVSFLFILFPTLMCGGLWGQWPVGERSYIWMGIPLLWVLWFLLRSLRRRIQDMDTEQEGSRRFWLRRKQEIDREIVFYKKREGEMHKKLVQRQNLAACAKDMGAVLDSGEIQTRLVDWAKKSFPDSGVLLSGFSEDDPIDAWVTQRRQALLCEEVSRAPRFKGARMEEGTQSLMVAPLWVESKIFGGLRVENPSSKRFGRDDLRFLDALATLASLALDNAVLYSRIEQLAVRDGLTKLLTHRAFKERVEEELLRAGRYHYPVSLLMIDVDFFKRVNDTYGHAAGDEVLRVLSQKLLDLARPVDVPARYGGEEFCLLLVQTSLSKAVDAAEELRKSLMAKRFEYGGHSFGVTVSIGVASYPSEATTEPQLVRIADQRLYKAKTGGRNKVEFTGGGK